MKFKELLKSKRYNCRTLSKDLGLSYQTLYNWNKGKKGLRIFQTLKDMANTLDITTDELIDILLEQ